MNLLEVRYDEDGNRRFYRDGEEVTEDVWRQQHPHMRKGNTSGRDRGSDSGNVGDSDQRERPDQQAEVEVSEVRRTRRERIKGQGSQAE